MEFIECLLAKIRDSRAPSMLYQGHRRQRSLSKVCNPRTERRSTVPVLELEDKELQLIGRVIYLEAISSTYAAVIEKEYHKKK